jgi:hypothetical protein
MTSNNQPLLSSNGNNNNNNKPIINKTSWFWFTAFKTSCWVISTWGYGFFLTTFLYPERINSSNLVVSIPLKLHTISSATALALMPFQLASQQLPRHSNIGLVYFTSVVLGGISSLMAAMISKNGPIAQSGFLCLGSSWLFTAAMGWWNIVRPNRERKHMIRHQNWMKRNMSLTYGAVTLRIMIPIGLNITSFEQCYPVIAWASWIPNLIVNEWLWIEDE